MNIITVAELKERLNNDDNLVLIDVREEYEHQEFNIGGRLRPLGGIQEWAKEIVDAPDYEYIMYCRSGQRSGMATVFLQNMGVPNVKNLQGGVIAWIENQ